MTVQADAPTLLTVEAFEQIADAPENADRRLELIDGLIAEKHPFSLAQGMVAGNVLGMLGSWVTPRKLARVGMSVLYRNGRDMYNARMPNISVSMARRPLTTRGNVPELPDIAIEIETPDDKLEELREKARFYLANGVRLVWLILPEARLIEVYTSEDEMVLTEADTLTGGDVLPGFSLPIAAVFTDPIT